MSKDSAKTQALLARTDDGRMAVLNSDGSWHFTSGGTQTTTDSDRGFRGVPWGTGSSDVKKRYEEQPEVEQSDVLSYAGTIAGMACLVMFIFVDDKLVRGKYVFQQSHSNDNDFLIDYMQLKDTLLKKYGEPEKDESIWKNNLYQSDPDEWGMAVSAGHLVFYSMWETPVTELYLGLSGDNYEVSLVIEYYSKALKELEEKMREDRDFNDL